MQVKGPIEFTESITAGQFKMQKSVHFDAKDDILKYTQLMY